MSLVVGDHVHQQERHAASKQLFHHKGQRGYVLQSHERFSSGFAAVTVVSLIR
jgi:hypothetical protein